MAVVSTPSGIPESNRSTHSLALGAALYAVVLAAFWFVAQHFSVESRIGGHMLSGFLSFALLLAPYWFFGFGAAGVLKRVLAISASRVLAPGLLVVPYLIFSIPRGEFQWMY